VGGGDLVRGTPEESCVKAEPIGSVFLWGGACHSPKFVEPKSVLFYLLIIQFSALGLCAFSFYE